ncbi:MAG: hypothetical protein ACI9LE_000942 [Paraglaciecola sp.]
MKDKERTMISSAIVLAAIDSARFYPSGDNCQCFRFHFSEPQQRLSIIYKAELAKHTLVYDDFVLTLTLGGLLEYLRIAFLHHGFAINYQTHPEDFSPYQDHAVATLTFSKGAATANEIKLATLKNRVTDRRAFLPPANLRKDLATCLFDSPLDVSAHTEAVDDTLQFFSICDSLVWQSRPLGMDIFNSVNFTQAPLTGLPPTNLGISKLQVLPIKLIQKQAAFYDIFKLCGAQNTQTKTQLTLWQSSRAFLCASHPKNASWAQKIIFSQQLMSLTLRLSELGYAFQPSTLSTEILNLPIKPLRNLQTTAALKLHQVEDKLSHVRTCLGLNATQQVLWIIRCGKVQSPLPQKARTHRLAASTLLQTT